MILTHSQPDRVLEDELIVLYYCIHVAVLVVFVHVFAFVLAKRLDRCGLGTALLFRTLGISLHLNCEIDWLKMRNVF